MAEYHLHAKTHSRGAGKGAGGHARYVLREGAYAQKLVEQVNGSVVEKVRVSRAEEVAYSESGNLPAWAHSPLDYWDAADQYERSNGTVYREIEFALPKELSDGENSALAHEFAERLSRVSGGHTPYTLAMHRSEQQPMLLHCHLMLSDKVNDGLARDPALWFRRASNPGKDPAKGGAPKTQARIGKDWLGEVVRPLWSDLANDALARAEVDARIDHRSLEARRIEQEELAAQASQRGDLARATAHQRAADVLDRPSEPKKGRVLTHAGAEKAPDRAALVVDFERAKAARAQAVAERRVVERAAAQVNAELAAARRILDRAQVRHAARQPMDGFATRSRWRARGVTRRNRVFDAETQAETRNGFRAPEMEAGHPARPAWAVYRERVLTEAYGAEVGRALGRWVKVEVDRGNRSLHIHNKGMDLTDYGDRVVAGMGGNDKEIAAMLKIAQAKGWKALTLTGSADFQLRAGAAALDAGFTLTDADLATRITAQRAAEVEARLVRDLEAAPVLAEWIRAHPKLAQAQRRAGGHLPFACPEGLDHADLQRSEVWAAADAWSVGRYGEGAEVEALKKDPDPLKAQAVGAGREAAFNAWARDGLTLRVGVDAPAGIGAIWHEASNTPTRADVERHAGVLMNRRKRAGVDHAVTVTFGMDVTGTERVLVLEHLLRQSVPLDGAALAKAGDGPELERARERLKTHEADGQQQVWYTQKLEQDRLVRQWEEAAKTRADLVKKLDALAAHLERHGSEDAERCFQEAGFVKDEKGFYAYPDPDLPGVQKAWDALKAAQRREFEADVQKRADRVGYRAESGQWRQEQRAADPEHQRLVQEIKDDPSLKEMANAAYKQGIDRAQQERLAQLEQDRKALRNAAYKLGRRAEKAGSNAVKQAEMQREFGELVQRGVDLGVDEKALSQSLQRGRVAYREEQQEHRYSSPGGGMRR